MTWRASTSSPPSESPGIPDVPEAILGWRTWRIGRRAQRRTELVAPLSATLWPAGEPMVATCGSGRHSPPGERCGCGLYAAADPRTLDWGPSEYEVLGVVALWGEIVQGARGWRASHGYPRFVITGPAITDEQRAALARRYRVPVHRCAIRLRDLAQALGGAPTVLDAVRAGTDVEALLAERIRLRTPPPAGRGSGRWWRRRR